MSPGREDAQRPMGRPDELPAGSAQLVADLGRSVADTCDDLDLRRAELRLERETLAHRLEREGIRRLEPKRCRRQEHQLLLGSDGQRGYAVEGGTALLERQSRRVRPIGAGLGGKLEPVVGPRPQEACRSRSERSQPLEHE